MNSEAELLKKLMVSKKIMEKHNECVCVCRHTIDT